MGNVESRLEMDRKLEDYYWRADVCNWGRAITAWYDASWNDATRNDATFTYDDGLASNDDGTASHDDEYSSDDDATTSHGNWTACDAISDANWLAFYASSSAKFLNKHKRHPTSTFS